MYLPENCTVQDVQDADSETIYYSWYSKNINYSTEVMLEMASQLTLRGL